jgi:histidinol-phosphate aminotransferase
LTGKGVVMKMSSWKDNLRKIEPYVPGEQPNLAHMIKLNTNENPYPPSPKVLEALKRFDTDSLRLYPDPDSKELVDALAERYHMKNDQIFVGVGSDDVLAIAFMTFFNSGKPILFPDITYSFYNVWAELFGIPYERPALDEEFQVTPQDYYRENGGVVIANPNAPTGVLQSLDFLRDVIEHNRDVVVIIDEAYVDFGGQSALELIKEYDNVLVVQTYSKSRSLAGMRIGYAFGSQELIRAMNDVRYSYNSYPMTRLSVALGTAALKDESYFQDTVSRVIETREWTKKELARLGFSFPDSKTNFIFAVHKSKKATDIFAYLREKHIFVRHFGAARIDNYLRISIGTREEMETLIRELEAWLNL